MKLIANLAEVDRQASERFGIASAVLMEAGGQAVADHCLKLIDANRFGADARILILCGSGNNGGDGFVAARFLAQAGQRNLTVWHPDIIYAGNSLNNQRALAALDVELTTQPASASDDAPDLVIDALFGSGLNRPLSGEFLAWVETIEAWQVSGKPPVVMSVDMPSGVDSETAQILGGAIKADHTVTFAAAKPGLYIYPGKACAGEIHVIDIGVPESLIDDDPSPYHLISEAQAQAFIPPRDLLGHKYQFGSVLVIAGCRTMPGAALLCAEAALSSGAGLVTVATPASVFGQLSFLPELLRMPLPETAEGTISKSALSMIVDALPRFDVVVLGPGMDIQPETQAWFTKLLPVLLNDFNKPVILDADGLNLLCKQDKLAKLPPRFILTPHTGEAFRLLDAKMIEVAAPEKLFAVAATLQSAWGGTVVLKSATTIIVTDTLENQTQQFWINTTGNSGMATAGSGDVLAGLIGGLAAQGKHRPVETAATQAAVSGVYLHGLAGDTAAAHLTQYVMKAGDILAFFPQAFSEVLQ